MNSAWVTYRRWNNITGWLMFLVATAVYIMTTEPTVSFWDCGEFILSAFRLQVGHPPGAPLFLMMGRIATLFAGGDTSRVAHMVNILSAICSGFTILFLFWTITHLVRRVFTRTADPDPKYIPAIIGSGIIGSLAYTFSDTFWFSAVEGELYAMSSLVTGLVFWAMLKWEEEADRPDSGRWIILISYIMGLGLGIHRLNLLVIPVLVFVFYFRKYEVTTKGLLITVLAAIAILGLMVFVLMPGVPGVAGWFELLFVNIFGLPYNSGLLFFIILLTTALIVGIRYSLKSRRLILNYAITSLAVIMIGYSSYAMIMIRSSARPPMNQNNPADVFSLSYYINMQQYGSSPLVFGDYYCVSQVYPEQIKKVIAGYNKVNGKYKPYYRPEYIYSRQFRTIFPRMYSTESEHEEAYKYWGNVKGRKFTVGSGTEKQTVVCPTFGENLGFFIRYQVGFMYLRYFMWNFVGRQNDIQGNGNTIDGNWISGIKFIDEARLGPLDNIPSDLKNNPANNKYYFLPLLLGLAGLFWQYKKDRNGFILVLAFFIMTGLAIILYLNQYPNQPRERDYAYAGSFYAFAIWIGIGFMMIYENLMRFLKSGISASITFVALLFLCPVLMAVENWDDHDRSGRYTARDIGANYVQSCAPDAILFTYGDNDSFPVWYVQDVEAIRNDVRVVNLSYIQAGWYIDMMRQKAFNSDPLPFSLGSEKYLEGIRSQLPVEKVIDKPVNIKDIVNFAGQDDRKYMMDYSGRGDFMNYLPTKKLLIDVDTSVVLANGTVKSYFRKRLLSPLIWEYNDDNAFKGDLAIMDLIATSKWSRPIYFSTTVPSSQYKGLEKFFVQEGMAYRIEPVKVTESIKDEFGMIDPVVMYDNVMNKFKWGNAEDPHVYLDENNRRMFSNFRRILGNLGKELIQEGDTTRALDVTRKALTIVPPAKLPYDFFTVGLAENLLRAGHKEEADSLIRDIISYSREYLDYAITLRPGKKYGLDYSIGINVQALYNVYNMAESLKNKEIMNLVGPLLNSYSEKL